MSSFSDFIEELSLVDLPLNGGWYTWSNFREVSALSRLDMFLISPEILGFCPDLFQCALSKGISDHNPISLSLMKTNWGLHSFKWFDYLGEDKDFVEEVYNACSKMYGIGIESILMQCKSILKSWVSEKLGSSSFAIRDLERKCLEVEKQIEDGNQDKSLGFKLKELHSNLWDLGIYRGDSLRWIGSSSSRYSIKSFCDIASSAPNLSDIVWKFVGSKLALPKVETFVWRALHDRVPTTSELAKRGSIAPDRLECPCCAMDPKTVDHLFCHCLDNWRIWVRWFNLWGISLALPGDLKSFIISWFSIKNPFKSSQIWRLNLLCFLWSLWLYRNEVVFKRLCFVENEVPSFSFVFGSRPGNAVFSRVIDAGQELMVGKLLLVFRSMNRKARGCSMCGAATPHVCCFYLFAYDPVFFYIVVILS
ncbi:hypothetical protein V6N13_107992 [Hibiscus sabdariffa]